MLNCYPWQDRVWETVSKQWQQKEFPHALMLEGQKGLGKFDFARILAARILCQDTSKKSLACGACRSCQLLHSFHPDLILLEPEEKSSNIKIDAIRLMIEKIHHTSTCGGYQVVIIHPAEAMNLNGANALLKTLEEPPDNVIFLLVSHQAARLPATVLSRCQRLIFPTPPTQDSIMWLKKQLPEQVEVVLRVSEYAPLRALDLAKRNFLSLRDDLLSDLQSILQHEESPLMKISDWLKQDLELFFLAFLSILLDVLRLLLRVDPSLLTHRDRLKELQMLSRLLNKDEVDAHLREVQHARELILGHHNPNAQLLIERVFLHVAGITHVN